ncbi:hypothetical protein ACPCXA_02055 [Lysinibacillus agricola]
MFEMLPSLRFGTLFVIILYTLLVLIAQNPPLFEEEKLSLFNKRTRLLE